MAEEEPEKTLDKMAAETRMIGEGIEAEMKEDVEKAEGGGSSPKRPWWKFWSRS
jgi:hypothetical protein